MADDKEKVWVIGLDPPLAPAPVEADEDAPTSLDGPAPVRSSHSGPSKARVDDRGRSVDVSPFGDLPPPRSGKSDKQDFEQPRGRYDPALLLAVVFGSMVGALSWWFFLRPPVEPEPIRYVVEQGDTLWHVARSHGVQVADIQVWNSLESDAIEVGQVLLIHAESEDAEVQAKSRSGRTGTVSGGRVKAEQTTPSTGSLRMPAAKTCLPGPEQLTLGDEGIEYAASAGLSYAQTKAAMDGFLPNLAVCVPEAGAKGTASLEITVGCTGRVAEIRVVDGGGLPAELTSCVRDRLGYAEFPAHDIADGFTFAYPVTFEFDG